MTTNNPTIASGLSGSVFRSSNSNVLTFYNVQSERISKSANLIDFPLPTLDSDSKIMMDLLGTSREVSVEGTVTSSDVPDIYKYANDLVGLKTVVGACISGSVLVFGTQGNNGGQAGWTYTPSVLNQGLTGSQVTITVYVDSVDVTFEKATPSSFSYSVNLKECSGTSSI